MGKKEELQKIEDQMTNLKDLHKEYDVVNLDDLEKLGELKTLEAKLFTRIKQFRDKRSDNAFNGTSTQKRWFKIEAIGVGVSHKIEELEKKSNREKDSRQENREDESLHLATKANVIAYYAMLLSALAVIIAVGVAWVSVGDILLKMISPYLK